MIGTILMPPDPLLYYPLAATDGVDRINAQTLTYDTGTPTVVAGMVGNGLNFSGTNSGGQCLLAVGSRLANADPCYMRAVFYPETAPGNGSARCIAEIICGTSNQRRGFGQFTTAGGVRLLYAFSGGAAVFVSFASGYDLNRWYVLEVFHPGLSGTATVWLNGVQQTLSALSTGSGVTALSFAVGRFYGLAGSRFDGTIQHVVVAKKIVTNSYYGIDGAIYD